AEEPAVEQCLTRGGEWSCRPHVLDDSHAAARPQNSASLAIEGGFVDRVADAFDGPDDVEAGVRKRGVEVVLLRKAHPIRDAALQPEPPGALHLAGHRRDP